MPDNTHQKVCLVIGDPVSHSLSPAMHNAAYKAVGIDSEYIFLTKQVKPEELAKAMKKDLRSANIRAFACTIPHKETAVKYLDNIDETAKTIGAVNTVLNNIGILKGYNTDWEGAINALQNCTSLKNKKIAILGSGGTACAIVYGLSREWCAVNLYSRNMDSALQMEKKFGCKIYDWGNSKEAFNSDIIINTTPIGRDNNTIPFSEEGITEQHVIFDVNYKKGGTQLINLAKSKSAVVIDGLEMLLQQGILQFELYTGLKAPEKAMREALSNGE